jgi:hypothetical protein
MRLYLADGTKIIATKRPRGLAKRQCFGRTWDRVGGVIDGVRTDFFFDSTWGTNFWFRFKDGYWYSVQIWESEGRRSGFGVAPLFTKNPKEATG